MLILLKSVRKILYINTAHLGDIVLSTPVVRALKKAYPDAAIDMLVSWPYGEAALYNPYVNQVFFYDNRCGKRNSKLLHKLLRQLRQQNYTLAVASCYSPMDPILALLSGATYRVGFRENSGGRFLTHFAPVTPLPLHETEHQLQVLAPLGIKAHDTAIEFGVPPEAVAGLYQRLPILKDSSRPKVVFCPCSQSPAKNYPVEAAAIVLWQLAKHADCFLIGTAKQGPELQHINSLTGNAATVLDGCLTLGELGALLRAVQLLITVDTGPMHIAQAFATPTVALFGPTSPLRWGPRHHQSIILQTNAPCAPCCDYPITKKQCQRPYCMHLITPVAVIEAANKLLTPYCQT